MPIEPVAVRVEIISTSSLNTWPSGVRTSTGNFVLAIRSQAPGQDPPRPAEMRAWRLSLLGVGLVDDLAGLRHGLVGLLERVAGLRELVALVLGVVVRVVLVVVGVAGVVIRLRLVLGLAVVIGVGVGLGRSRGLGARIVRIG